MSKILGKNVLLYIVTNASPEVRTLIGCSRTCSLNTNANIAGKSTIGSGKWQEFKGLSMNWTVSIDGLCTVGENMGLADFRQLQFALQPVQIYFEEVTATSTINYYGAAIITSVQTTGPYADVENYSIQLQGTGYLLIYSSSDIYGNYPALFQIISIVPYAPGFSALSLVWDAASPLPGSYTVQYTDTTIEVTTWIRNIPEIGHTVDIVVNNNDDYNFAIQSDYGIFGKSIYSPSIAFINPFYLINSDGSNIVNSDGKFILTQ